MLPLDCLLTPLPSPPSWDPLNCLEARSGSFWTLSPRLFWEEEEEEEEEEEKKEDEEVLR